MNHHSKILILKGIVSCLLLACLAELTIILLVLNNHIVEDKNQNFYCGVTDFNHYQYSNSNPMDSVQHSGKVLFDTYCSSCHSTSNETIVGPGLKGITTRRSKKWIIKWVQNSKKILSSGDKYAVNLYQKFHRTDMPSFKQLSAKDINGILVYIEGY